MYNPCGMQKVCVFGVMTDHPEVGFSAGDISELGLPAATCLLAKDAHLVILKYGSWSMAQGMRHLMSRCCPNM